jgi:hypothetical protein
VERTARDVEGGREVEDVEETRETRWDSSGFEDDEEEGEMRRVEEGG